MLVLPLRKSGNDHVLDHGGSRLCHKTEQWLSCETHFIIGKYKPVSHELVFSTVKSRCQMFHLCTSTNQFYPRFLVSELLLWLQRALPSFLPSVKRGEMGCSINIKPSYCYQRYVLHTFSGYLVEWFCINYLWCVPLNVFWARRLHVCGMYVNFSPQSNGPVSVRDSGSPYRKDKHRDCPLSFWNPL